MSADYRSGDRIVTNGSVHVLSADEASMLRGGGMLVQLPTRIDVVPPAVVSLVNDAVTRARRAFEELGGVDDDAISATYEDGILEVTVHMPVQATERHAVPISRNQ